MGGNFPVVGFMLLFFFFSLYLVLDLDLESPCCMALWRMFTHIYMLRIAYWYGLMDGWEGRANGRMNWNKTMDGGVMQILAMGKNGQSFLVAR
ncbi:hypothetical protein EYC80_000460 [Monilinia laxa]|uniref:Uncharacterized protein n=1 Tax=Monilinia laxa TaxID=61186 RepID=A0A5N6KAT6_MONLA|nr:hypothetical protein EYC80_000460 [Monilinia laxa]